MDSRTIDDRTRGLCQTLTDELLAGRGGDAGYSVKQSHWGDPVAEGEMHGASRRWGDAPRALKLDILSRASEVLTSEGLGELEVAAGLAIMKIESGFNPDAASQFSSASGLGQFIDSTWKGFGGAPEERFQIEPQLRIFGRYLKESLGAVNKLRSKVFGSDIALTYARYHDGPNVSQSTVDTFKTRIEDEYTRFRSWVGLCRFD